MIEEESTLLELYASYIDNETQDDTDDTDDAPAPRDLEERVIDPMLEHKYVESLWYTSDELTFLMGYTPNSAEYFDARAALHRGLSFALQAVDVIKRVDVNGLSNDYFNEIAQYDNPAAILKGEVIEYLRQRQAISKFITTFIPSIDGTRDEDGRQKLGRMPYADEVELSAGLVFMLSEREHERIYHQIREEKTKE